MALQLDPEFKIEAVPFLAKIPPIPPCDDIQARRQLSKQLTEIFKDESPLPDDVEIMQHAAPTPDGYQVPVYRFSKKASAAAKNGPAILHIHGGGMFLGEVKSSERALAEQVSATGNQIFSVEYRLAPEHRHPTLVEDCWAALTWLHKESARFGVDSARIAVMGESAGGGIAAGLALLARDRHLDPPLAKQILIYPMLDDRNIIPDPILERFAVWKAADNAAGWEALLGDSYGTDDVSQYAAPARATSFVGLPDTYLDVGGLDIFRGENIRYALGLANANVSVEFHLYPGVPHGFEGVSKVIGVTKRALANRKAAMMSF